MKKILSIIALNILLTTITLAESTWFEIKNPNDNTSYHFNLKKTKYNNLLGVVFSIIISYLAFFISIGLYFGIGYILMQFIEFDKLEEISIYGYNMKNLLMLLPVCIFSPILIFLLYKFLFKINKSNYTKIIIWITIIILIVFGLVKKDFEDENSSAFWQLTMALALQLILYENEIIEFIKNKNTAYNNSYK